MNQRTITNSSRREAGRALLATALLAIATVVTLPSYARAEHDGLLTTADGKKLFPIGCYELPEDDAKLKAMVDAGINLIRCRNRDDLDRVAKLGAQGVMPLNFAAGPTDGFRKQVEAVADHPALAVWEGPDEIVWNFTAYSGLYRKAKVHKVPHAWWKQTPAAVAYAEKRASKIMPNMRDAIGLIRKADKRNRPVWINEAQRSDVRYCRRYMDWIDITGCDIYPVSERSREITRVGISTERWKMIGRGKPVYMVIQGFSWHELGDYYGHKKAAYPTFTESRHMAYNVITHGARGILYWGSHYLKSEPFRQSIYALTNELAALQPFLVAPEVDGVSVRIIENVDTREMLGVRHIARRVGDDWIIVLVNEDDCRHMGVEVHGLNALNGRKLVELYGTDEVTIAHGELIARMEPLEVEVFATSRKWETKRREGRDFVK